jgi:molybdopterin converting factor small subunit
VRAAFRDGFTAEWEVTKSEGEAMSTVGEDIQNEIRRVRDVLLPRYDAIPSGKFGALILRQALDRATKALAEGDVVAIVRSYAELKGCE